MNTAFGFVHEFVPGASDRTLLLLHGTGGDERDLIPLGRDLDPAAALLSPRGKVLENGMPRFFRRLAEGVFDEEDLKARAVELADFVSEAAQHYQLDANKITAVGFSNGANIASAMLLSRGAIFRAAILFRPMVPFVPESLPDLREVRVRIAEGDQDPIVSASETERLGSILRKAGAAVSCGFSNAGHGLTGVEVQSASVWLHERRLV